MKQETCMNCDHYRQHYILDKQRCCRINCAHCTYPRLKHRTPDTAACVHFQPKDNSTDDPAVIHFLTEELLRHLLTFLPPPDRTE